MHMADALLSPGVAATMYVTTGITAGICVNKLKADENSDKLPLMAVTSALVFAGQMVNYTIPGTGSSGHLCGGMMLSALLGPYAGFLSMMVILAIQCLFFADGGLMALGANCWNMGFYGCFVGYFLIWRPLMLKRQRRLAALEASGGGDDGRKSLNRFFITLAAILGCTLTLQLGAFSVVIETSLSGITELPFAAFLGLMQPIHLAIGLVEGLITAAVLNFVLEARPELLEMKSEAAAGSIKRTVVILAVITVMTGGGLSLLASSNPDGLEWSMFGNEDGGYSANMALDEEAYGVESSVSRAAGQIQEKTAFLPDYAFKGSDSSAGTTVSGLLGSAIVAAIAIALCLAGGFFRKHKTHKMS